MFSVLLRYAQSKREVLIPARSVEFVPRGSGARDEGLLINHGVSEEGGCHLPFTPAEEDGSAGDWRDVFVMNAQGQTVARYAL